MVTTYKILYKIPIFFLYVAIDKSCKALYYLLKAANKSRLLVSFGNHLARRVLVTPFSTFILTNNCGIFARIPLLFCPNRNLAKFFRSLIVYCNANTKKNNLQVHFFRVIIAGCISGVIAGCISSVVFLSYTD